MHDAVNTFRMLSEATHSPFPKKRSKGEKSRNGDLKYDKTILYIFFTFREL